MAVFAAWALFAWGAVAAGYGVYAVSAALASQSAYHAVQAGSALLIATVSISAGLLLMALNRLGRVVRPPAGRLEDEGAGEQDRA